jgi:hypothetical protein
VLLFYTTPAAGTSDLIINIRYAFWRVLHRKRFSQNITVPVAKHNQVIIFGIIHRYAHHFIAATLMTRKNTI